MCCLVSTATVGRCIFRAFRIRSRRGVGDGGKRRERKKEGEEKKRGVEVGVAFSIAEKQIISTDRKC